MRKLWVRETMGLVRWVLEMTVKTERESEAIRKVCGGERGKDRIHFRHWKMARISAVKIKAELRWW